MGDRHKNIMKSFRYEKRQYNDEFVQMCKKTKNKELSTKEKKNGTCEKNK